MPSFLLYLTVGDLIAYLAYQFVFALGESLLVALTIAGIAYALPGKRLRARAGAAGVLLVFSFALSAVLFKNLGALALRLDSLLPVGRYAAVQIAAGTWAFSLIALPFISYKLAGKPRVARAVGNFVENLYVLTVLYVALSAISLLVVIFRNLPEAV